MPELQHHLALSREVHMIGRHRRSQRVAAHGLEPVPLAGGDHHVGVQIEAVRARVMRPLKYSVSRSSSSSLSLGCGAAGGQRESCLFPEAALSTGSSW